MGRSLIPQRKVRQLWDAGLNPAEIVAILRDEDHISVTPEAISNWRRRCGLPPRRKRADLIPWKLRPEHADRWPVQMLRLESRVRRGDAITNEQLRWLASWKRKLAENDTVLHYEPEVEPAFFNVPRRPGVDLDLVREPER